MLAEVGLAPGQHLWCVHMRQALHGVSGGIQVSGPPFSWESLAQVHRAWELLQETCQQTCARLRCWVGAGGGTSSGMFPGWSIGP